MSALPAVANLLAVWELDASASAAIVDRMRTSGAFGEIRAIHGDWVVARRLLADSAPETAPTNGAFFVEGSAEPRAMPHPADDDAATAAALSAIPGDFSFVRIHDGEALVVRAIAGHAPLYVWQSQRRIAIATRLEWLCGFADVPREPDPLIYAIWASMDTLLPDGRTAIKNVRLVSRGTFLRIRPPALVPAKSYFTLPAIPATLPTEDAIDDAARRTGADVIAYLDRQCSRSALNLCSLSGGVDSSSALAICAGVLKRPTASWSLVPDFEPDRSRELSFIEPLVKRYAVAPRWVRTLGAETMFGLLDESPAGLLPANQQILMALPRLLKDAPIRTVFGGEFADEALGSVKTLPDLSMSLGAAAAAKLAATAKPSVAARWAKHQLAWRMGRPLLPYSRGLPRHFSTALREEYAEWRRRRVHELLAGDPGRAYFLASWDKFDAFAVMNWETCSPLDVRRLTPFYHRRIIEASAALHPWGRVRDGFKTLLRRGLREHVPAQNLYRRDKGLFSRNPLPPPKWVEVPPRVAHLLDMDFLANRKLDAVEYATVAALDRWLPI